MYKPTSHDHRLSRFFNSLKDIKEYTTQVTIMIRLKGYDSAGKQKEYLTWIESLSGFDREGNSIAVHDIPCGQTNELVGIQYHEGQPVPASYPSKTNTL